MHLKPRGLRYVGCRSLTDRQGKPLEAMYRVAGPFAVRVERYFVQAVGLPRLRRSCCQWDTPQHSFHGSDGREYDITMVSDETPAHDRTAWAGVRVFEVVVAFLTEEI